MKTTQGKTDFQLGVGIAGCVGDGVLLLGVFPTAGDTGADHH